MERAECGTRAKVRAAMAMGLLCLLSACSDDEKSDTATANGAPRISGAPPTLVHIGEPYSFSPSVRDPDGDRLRFTASGLPRWAELDPETGRLAGTPWPGTEGTYAGIRISVSDGQADAALAPFAITVVQNGTGVATLSWLPPTENADGTPLLDLAGYRILYGRNASDLDRSIAISNPSINTYVVEQLSPGTWYFAVIALNARSFESGPSNAAGKTVS